MFNFIFLMIQLPTISTLFPYTTLFRSKQFGGAKRMIGLLLVQRERVERGGIFRSQACGRLEFHPGFARSEEHTSELQSRVELVCRLLLEKKKFGLHRRTRKLRARPQGS